ncbi:hypothetical protein [Lactobacillus delbrueckii]
MDWQRSCRPKFPAKDGSSCRNCPWH